MSDRISIIMPVSNGEQYILQALASIAAQNPSSAHLIIVDDNSTDNTLKCCQQFQHPGISVSIINTQNGCPAVSRNLALASCNSTYVTFLDHDDWWPKDRLYSHLDYLENNPTVDIVMGKTQTIASDVDRLKNFRFPNKEQVMYGVNLGACTFRKTVFDTIGFFDEERKFCEDFDFFMRIKEASLKMYYLESVALYYRLHDTNMTKDKSAKELAVCSMLRQSLRRRDRKTLPEFSENS